MEPWNPPRGFLKRSLTASQLASWWDPVTLGTLPPSQHFSTLQNVYSPQPFYLWVNKKDDFKYREKLDLLLNKWSEVKVVQSCPTRCDLMDWVLPGSSVHRILQARILQWLAHSLLQGIFLTQRSNPGLPHCRQIPNEKIIIIKK